MTKKITQESRNESNFLKVNKSLGDLVSSVEDANFNSKYALHAQDKVWQMYVKQDSGVLQLAYISDHCEVLLTETFRGIQNKGDEERTISSILETYKTHLRNIQDKKEVNNGIFATSLGVGALAGFLFMRHPFGILLGEAMGYFVHKLVHNYRIKNAETDLESYLSSHNISLGQGALRKISYMKKFQGGNKNE